MPVKNCLKVYKPNAYYHVYNRGVEKRTIFQTERDYKIFLSYLKFYLQGQSLQVLSSSRQPNNFYDEIELLAYILMPNHFHMLLYQTNTMDINYFMRSLMTKYVGQFNKRYQRVGPLFQSRYKAVLIESKDQLIYTTKYIHRNCLDLFSDKLPARTVLAGYKYSSYLNYTGVVNQIWVNPEPVLRHYLKLYPNKLYKNYVWEEGDGFKDCP